MPEFVVRHPHPVWADRVEIESWSPIDDQESAVELVPVGQGPHGAMVVCALPFFIYGYSLGDEVQLDPSNRLDRLLRRSGTYTYRVILDDRAAHNLGEEEFAALRAKAGRVKAELTPKGFLLEWYTPSLLAVGALSLEKATELVKWLDRKESLAELTWESAEIDE